MASEDQVGPFFITLDGKTAKLFRLLLVLEREKLWCENRRGLSQYALAEVIISTYLKNNEQGILEAATDVALRPKGGVPQLPVSRRGRRHRAPVVPAVPRPSTDAAAHDGGAAAPTTGGGDKASE